MQRLTDTDGLTELQGDILRTVDDSLRIHGGYGYSAEHEIERLLRDAPMLLIGEGTAEIQKMIIGRALVRDYGR
jgi:alkylation response protein AidB-like acyl-CoA dehydrogenase